MQSLTALVKPLINLCRQAGDAICAHYHAPGETEVRSKHDDSPLTRADLDSHVLLRDGLKTLKPVLPVLSEESSPEHQAQRREWPRYWLVDPLDGTKEFIAGNGEFTVNIALISQHRPILGVLYLPLEQRAYVGIPGVVARVYQYDGISEWASSELATRAMRAGAPVTLLASRRHGGKRLQSCLDWLRDNWGEIDRRNSGSALKFCQLAEGGGDFYPRFSPCCEWDVAAGQALVEAAGGQILGLDGTPLRYNCRNTLLSPNFYAIADPAHSLWQRFLAVEH